METTRILWAPVNDKKAVSLAAEVKIDGDVNCVDVNVTDGPSVSIELEEDGRLTITLDIKGHDVRIKSDLFNDRCEECLLVEKNAGAMDD